MIPANTSAAVVITEVFWGRIPPSTPSRITSGPATRDIVETRAATAAPAAGQAMYRADRAARRRRFNRSGTGSSVP